MSAECRAAPSRRQATQWKPAAGGLNHCHTLSRRGGAEAGFRDALRRAAVAAPLCRAGHGKGESPCHS